MKFNDTILQQWKSRFIFSTYEQSMLFNNDITISKENRNKVFNCKQIDSLQVRFFNHILYSNVSANYHKVSFDICASNIIDILFDFYASNDTLILTTQSEHPSVVNNLNKCKNIIYINDMDSLIDIQNKLSAYKNVLLYICATPALSTNIIPNSIVENIQMICKNAKKTIISILDDVQGFFLYPRSYDIYDYVIGTAHAIIPGFNLGFVISKKDDSLFNMHSETYENMFIDRLDHILKYKSLLYQYSMVLTQYYSILQYYDNKFKLYNEIPFKFFIIDQGKIDAERNLNPSARIPTYLIGSTDINDNSYGEYELNRRYKELAAKNNKLYYSTGLFRSTLSILDFDSFLKIIHKINLLINNMLYNI